MGELITLSLPIDDNDWSIQWSTNNSDNAFSCDTCFTTTITLNASTTISYTLTHEESECVFNYEFTLKLIEQKDLFLPSAFSPNEDGNNDFWEVFTSSRVDQVLECSIFDRWGEQIAFWENTKTIKWDGTFNGQSLNPAVFVYYIRYTLKNGEVKIVKGDFVLVK